MQTQSNAYVKIQDLSKWYPVKAGLAGAFQSAEQKKWIKAVDGVTLSIDRGEILGIIGESGCGKSTLGRVLTGLEPPTAGDVVINGQSFRSLIRKDAKAARRLVQIIFQNPFDTFTPRDTIRKILLRPLNNHGIGSGPEEREQMCLKALEEGGLRPAADIMDRYPHQLSGGQLQRISIIRAMFLTPSFLIADEPVSMLDVSVRADIINMLIDVSAKRDASIVFISHDISLTRFISKHIAVMYLGRIVEYGRANQVIHDPKHPYTQALISNCASIDVDDKRQIIQIEGEPPTPVNPGPGCYFAGRCFKTCPRCFEAYPPMTDMGDGHLSSCWWYAK